MASSLFGTTGRTATTNPMYPASNAMTGMAQRFAEFRRAIGNQNPQQIVQNLLATGQMSQAQFKQLAAMAKQLQGFLR